MPGQFRRGYGHFPTRRRIEIARTLEWTEQDQPRRFRLLEFTQVEGFINENIPLILDTRAATDQKGKPKLSSLYQAIQKWRPGTWVITDGLGQEHHAISHQSARGVNGLERSDIVTILTFLSPDQYAQLCLLVKRFDLDDIIGQFYRDRLRQALGRNRGMRRSDQADPSHHVVLSDRLLPVLGPDSVMDLGWYQLDLAHAPWDQG